MTYVFACCQAESAPHKVWRVNTKEQFFTIDENCKIYWEPKMVLEESSKSLTFHKKEICPRTSFAILISEEKSSVQYYRLFPIIRWFVIYIVEAKDIRRIAGKTGNPRFDFCISQVRELHRRFHWFMLCWWRYRTRYEGILTPFPAEIIEKICLLGLGK